MIPNASPATRRRASYWGIVIALGCVGLLPLRHAVAAEYLTYAIVFVASAPIAAFVEWRWRVTNIDIPVGPKVPLLTGVVLILAYGTPPIVAAAVYGALGGGLLGGCVMVLIREGFRARTAEGTAEPG